MQSVALINGVNWSWANASLILFNIPIIGITKIELEEKQNKVNNFGAGTYATSRGYGNVEATGTITMYADEVKKIVDASPNRKLTDIPMFDIPLILSSTKVPFMKIVARACEFTSNSFKVNQGDGKVLVELPLIIAQIDW